jgi:sialate O-acetylesterase
MKGLSYLTLAGLSIYFFLVSCSSKRQAAENLAQSIVESPLPPLQVNSLFSDNMVLQRDDYVAVWGKATPNTVVSVQSSWNQKAKAFADNTGEWMTKIKTDKAGRSQTLTIASDEDTITINNVMFGEVWLASGQSNMEMPVKGWLPNDPIQNSANEIASANYPDIRMITVQRNKATKPLDDFTGSWITASPSTVGDFSATAYFFARELYQELGVPIGIIHTSWGGTPAEAWTSKERLLSLGDFDKDLSLLGNKQKEQESAQWFSSKQKREIPDSDFGWNTLDLSDTDAAKSIPQNRHSITLPGRYDNSLNTELNGVFWLYKEFELNKVSRDMQLKIGAIDDMDATYINGKSIGSMVGSGKHSLERNYHVPKKILKKGTNVIAIKAIDTGGPGSVRESMTLESSSESISLQGDWIARPAAEIHDGAMYVYEDWNALDRPDIVQTTSHTPSVLYNAMIHPISPYSMTGAIWYQGESNVSRHDQYRRLFPAMIADWRKQWGSSFPFYFVQIAPYNYGNGLSAGLRDAQRQTLSLPNTGMVVTMDIGNYDNIHPANKQDVGKRLAGLALANDYGKELVASGPVFKSVKFENGEAVVSFDQFGSTLKASPDGLTGFELAGNDNTFYPAKAEIQGDVIIVKSSKVNAPAIVRYAWDDKGIPTLFNEEGLPASSFSARW